MLNCFLNKWIILNNQGLTSITHYFKEYFQCFVDIFTQLFLLFLYLVISWLKYFPFNMIFFIIDVLLLETSFSFHLNFFSSIHHIADHNTKPIQNNITATSIPIQNNTGIFFTFFTHLQYLVFQDSNGHNLSLLRVDFLCTFTAQKYDIW